MEILPEISGFYNFYEVFAHFQGCFANKELDILLYVSSIPHLDGWYFAALLFLSNPSLPRKYRKTNHSPSSSLKVPKQNQSQPTHSIWAMCITPASHFRRGFSVGEIHCLRRLNREGFPERFSRSQQLVRWSVAPASEQSPLSECVRLEQLSTH